MPILPSAGSVALLDLEILLTVNDMTKCGTRQRFCIPGQWRQSELKSARPSQLQCPPRAHEDAPAQTTRPSPRQPRPRPPPAPPPTAPPARARASRLERAHHPAHPSLLGVSLSVAAARYIVWAMRFLLCCARVG